MLMRSGPIHLCLALGAVLVAGCSQEERINTERAEAAFEIVAGTNRVMLDRIFTNVREARHGEALQELRELQRSYKLNPSQEMAVADLIARLEQRTKPSPRPGGATPGGSAERGTREGGTGR